MAPYIAASIPKFHSTALLCASYALRRQTVLSLNETAADWPSFGAMVSGLRESPMPADKDFAGQIEGFITDWQAQQREKATQ